MNDTLPAAKVEVIELHGAMLRRGFWLSVWEATSASRKDPLLYVGRTGDNSSPNAQSPFVRMGQHLGFAKTSNMLRTHLSRYDVEPEGCEFRLIAYGPILEEGPRGDMEEHKRRRNHIGALEKRLADHLRLAGYKVMNDVKSQWEVDEHLYSRVLLAFAPHFPALTR